MFDPRQFLIGAAGSLLTTAFVRKAKIFSLRNYEPLLTPPGRRAEETLSSSAQRQASRIRQMAGVGRADQRRGASASDVAGASPRLGC